jgi:hypothetical protein
MIEPIETPPDIRLVETEARILALEEQNRRLTFERDELLKRVALLSSRIVYGDTQLILLTDDAAELLSRLRRIVEVAERMRRGGER